MASVVATSMCDTFVLSASDFHEVLEEFPCVRARIEQVAEERLNQLRAKQNKLQSSADQQVYHNPSRTSNVDQAVQHPEV